MPTYEYECGDCAHHFEEFQGITEDKLTTCPECGKDTLERLIGAGAAVLFKGSGFYQTDYRSQEYTDKAKSDSSPESSGDSKTDAKSDSSAASSDSAPAETKSAPESGAKSAPESGAKSPSKSPTAPKPKRDD